MGTDRATGIDFNHFGSEFGVPSGPTSKLLRGELICCFFKYFRKFTENVTSFLDDCLPEHHIRRKTNCSSGLLLFKLRVGEFSKETDINLKMEDF